MKRLFFCARSQKILKENGRTPIRDEKHRVQLDISTQPTESAEYPISRDDLDHQPYIQKKKKIEEALHVSETHFSGDIRPCPGQPGLQPEHQPADTRESHRPNRY
jgi:hypothetical protein